MNQASFVAKYCATLTRNPRNRHIDGRPSNHRRPREGPRGPLVTLTFKHSISTDPQARRSGYSRRPMLGKKSVFRAEKSKKSAFSASLPQLCIFVIVGPCLVTILTLTIGFLVGRRDTSFPVYSHSPLADQKFVPHTPGSTYDPALAPFGVAQRCNSGRCFPHQFQ
jgi:hypothetical protein